MGLGGTPIFGYIGMCSPQGIVLSYLSEKGYGIDFDLSEIGYVFVACEYSRLSFALATTCETRRDSHVVARANERRLYSQANVFHTSWALRIFRFPGTCDTTQAFSRISARTSQNFQTFPLLSFRRDRKSILYQPLHKLRHE